MSGDEQDPDDKQQLANEKFDRTASMIRRIGYVVFFGAALLIAIPMIISAIQGVQQDRVWDPFTGAPVAADDPDLDCIDEASDLAYLAGEYAELDRQWEQRFRRWRTRCQQENADLYRVLTRIREQLRGAQDPPQLEDLNRNTMDGADG